MATNQIVKPNPVATLRTMLEASRQQISLALPKHLTADRVLRIAMTTVQKTPKLLECDPISVVAAIIEASQLGLTIDGVLGEAYLVPYYLKKRSMNVAQFQPGYRGLINLARRSGQVSTIYAELIFKCDKFKIALGTEKKLIHEPNYEDPTRGSIDDNGQMVGMVGAYAVVVFKDGETDFEYLPLRRLNELRAFSKSSELAFSPWQTPLAIPDMYKKAPIRALAKRLPLSPEFQRAAMIDEYRSVGVDVPQPELETAEAVKIATETQTARLREKYTTKPEDESQETSFDEGSMGDDSVAAAASALPQAEREKAKAAQAEIERRRKEEPVEHASPTGLFEK